MDVVCARECICLRFQIGKKSSDKKSRSSDIRCRAEGILELIEKGAGLGTVAEWSEAPQNGQGMSQHLTYLFPRHLEDRTIA